MTTTPVMKLVFVVALPMSGLGCSRALQSRELLKDCGCNWKLLDKLKPATFTAGHSCSSACACAPCRRRLQQNSNVHG
jgi:hypothetical protein